jgi:hypothetical protein
MKVHQSTYATHIVSDGLFGAIRNAHSTFEAQQYALTFRGVRDICLHNIDI